MLNGLGYVNIELSSMCNKHCFCCGRRKIEKNYPKLANWGHMDMSIVKKIVEQLPPNIVVSLHNNGESLLHPQFEEIVKLFKHQIRVMDTNGKLLIEKKDDIINYLDTITISIIEKDTEWEKQYMILKKFLKVKKNKKPRVILRCLGNIEDSRMKKYEDLNCLIVKRILHSPMGSFSYEKKVTIPEIGICLDMLNHLAIDRFGDVSICVRFDPHRLGVINNIQIQSLEEIWNGEKRKKWLKYHIEGKRNLIPLCSKCDYYGVPTG